MNILLGLLYLVCAAMSSTASYFDGGDIAKCVDGTEVSRDDCLAGALDVTTKALSFNSVFPVAQDFQCGCFIWYGYYTMAYFKDPDSKDCNAYSDTGFASSNGWSANVVCQHPSLNPVDLGTAGSFAILTKSGVTTTGTTSVIGHMGTSPIAQTALTGFALTLTGDHSTSSMVTGNVYAADHAAPTPTMMTTAIYDMEAAYTDAAGRAGPGSVTVGLGLAGDISGLTLVSGIYKWSTTVKFDTTLTFTGTSTDVWIMQIAGTFTAGPSARVILAEGAKAENIYWAIADVVAFDDGSHGEGIFLAKTMISFNEGSSLYGAAFAQTAVTMISTDIVGAL